MSFSRLNPRSTRTGIAQKRSASTRTSDSQKHHVLWAAIRKTQDELEQWQRQFDQVDELFRRYIVPREHRLTHAIGSVTEQLIRHFRQSDLDIPAQSLIGLWINENLNSLKDHPFADSARSNSLNSQWLELLNNDGPVEAQLARLARHNNAGPPSVDEHDNPRRKAESGDTNTGTAKDTYADTDTDTDTDTLKSLEDKLSVERLFRQLAKVLHPDREQDESLRAEKHVLMSQCLKARQEKDINLLLELYCEYVGELPDDLNNNSHRELISALEAQLKTLQNDLRHKKFGDPMNTMIVERYASPNPTDAEQRIQRHADSLDTESLQAELLVESLDSYDGLLDALEERRAVEQDRLAIDEMTGIMH